MRGGKKENVPNVLTTKGHHLTIDLMEEGKEWKATSEREMDEKYISKIYIRTFLPHTSSSLGPLFFFRRKTFWWTPGETE